jgi:GDP-4-dehydro-6-deoxy-D-mannose reductase
LFYSPEFKLYSYGCCLAKNVIMITVSEKILVTGINGFVGHHVAQQLHKRGFEVLGIGNQSALDTNLVNIVDEYVGCDLTSPEEVAKINLANIDAIINLAGFAKVGDSRGQGELYNRVNVGVHTVLYEECLRQKVYPRIIAVSTGAVYDSKQPLPITEESVLIPDERTNEYVISKKLMEQEVSEFGSKGLRVIVARPFNHSGPGQLPGFLLPDLGEQIKEALKEKKPLMVGNLQTKRDYTDVRDVARAYIALATCANEKLTHEIYNICSGKSVAGTEILNKLTKAFGADSISVKVDENRIRANDVMDIYGSRERITQDTDWAPEISVETMINDYAEWKKSQ